jgi:mono/diheme cytochrome c family protein
MKRSAAGAVAAVGAVLLTVVAARSDDPKKERPPVVDPPKMVRPVVVADRIDYISHGGCAQCHKEPSETYRKEQRTHFVHLTESVTWEKNDLHSYAYEALEKSELSKRMNALLRWKAPDGKPLDTWKSADCLACHAVDKHPELPLADKRERVEKKGVGNVFITSGGVGCEACHGPAEGWNTPHYKPEEEGADTVRVPWRAKTPEEKFSRGQIDLRDPHVRTRVCASCHVGSAAEGKFVTHEMYAAGHPPLPGFEVATFSRDQPYHAWPSSDVTYIKELADKKPDDAWKLFHYRAGEGPVVRLIALGAVTTFRESMDLLRGEARKCMEAKGDQSGGASLDFAHFDCYACHHDLRVDSERQKRGYDGVPGRPRMKPAATALLDAVVEHAVEALGTEGGATLKERAAELKKQLAELNRAFDRRVYGDLPAVADTAGKLVALSDQILVEMDRVKYSPDQAEKLLAKLAASANPKNKALYDYDAARQLAWVVDQLAPAQSDKGPALAEQLKKLSAITPLQLRQIDKRVPIEQQLPERLKLLYGFQADRFFDAFGGLAGLLAPQK